MGDVSGRQVARPVTKVEDRNVEGTLQTLRKQRAKFERVERAAADGDLVNIDFEGLIAGQPFDGNKAANFTVVLGEKRMLPDFEAALAGMKAGEQKTFPLVFPQDYAEARQGQDRGFHRHREPGRRAAAPGAGRRIRQDPGRGRRRRRAAQARGAREHGEGSRQAREGRGQGAGDRRPARCRRLRGAQGAPRRGNRAHAERGVWKTSSSAA